MLEVFDHSELPLAFRRKGGLQQCRMEPIVRDDALDRIAQHRDGDVSHRHVTEDVVGQIDVAGEKCGPASVVVNGRLNERENSLG